MRYIVSVFSGLRTYALSNGNLLFGLLVFGMSATFIIPNTVGPSIPRPLQLLTMVQYTLAGLKAFSLPSPLNCVTSNSVASMTR